MAETATGSLPLLPDEVATTRLRRIMAEAAGVMPLLHALPDEISIREILVRLPPKTLLRCRAVCAWRRATSTPEFLLAHHARQPALPLLYSKHYNCSVGDDIKSIDIIPYDQRQPTSSSYAVTTFICNPGTRQYAPLHQLDGFGLLGMYSHRPTGDYRLLLYIVQKMRNDGCYLYTLGSGQPPRHIGCPDDKELMKNIVDIWVMQDYEGEVWALHRRIELPIAEIMGQFQTSGGWFDLVAASWDGDVLLLIQFEGNWLLQVDMDGKLIANIHRRFLCPTLLRLKQSLVSHTFFPALEGYVVNASPFHLT
ncbi:uncharacterized protein LOC125547188 [Triticum urartu]|uniref:uncharacterized protein LOC125547188 n=1 Tax=Triticum urartu TaxID=4572 RepID=UPI00204451D3|nr:uncharacterized protein LOC125547188 [Triticum urartu]